MDLVGFGQFIARMCESLGESAVIGQYEEAFGVHIKTANVKKAGKFCWEKIEDCIAGFRVDG